MSYPRVGVDSPGRVVFLSFPLDTVPATGSPPNNEARAPAQHPQVPHAGRQRGRKHLL